MNQIQWLLLPLFIHLALLHFVGIKSLVGRINAVRSGKTRLKDIALNAAAWPDDVRKFGNNFANQFELPTFWYALCALLVATNKIDSVEILLGWAFVAARLVHTSIHVTSNFVPRRMYAFLASFAILTTMWVWFALRLYFIG
jgi:hypothetical protein